MVEQLTHDPEFKGSNLDTTATKRTKSMLEILSQIKSKKQHMSSMR